MRASQMLAVTVAVLLSVSGAAWAGHCNPPCTTDTDDCATVDASGNSSFSVQIGGEGSKSSNGSVDPGRLTGNEIGTGLLEFTYNNVSGQLTIVATNTTYSVTNAVCSDEGPWDSILQSFYWNVNESNVGDVNEATPFVSATGNNTAGSNWALVKAFKADGFGWFDFRIQACGDGTCEDVNPKVQCSADADCAGLGGTGVCVPMGSSGNGCNEGLASDAGGGDGTATFTMDVTPAGGSSIGAITACDFIAESVPPPAEKLTDFAGRYQAATNGGSGWLDSCDEPTFVELFSFETVPADGTVTVEWETALEIDNEGFYVWRADLESGTVERVSDFIPAIAENNQGAFYSFVDTTAVNGVEYTYSLEDRDLFGVETFHPARLAIPNPVEPEITLAYPAYGSTVFGSEPLTVGFEALGHGFAILFSSDPTFQDAGRLLTVRANKDGDVRLTHHQMGQFNRIAAYSDGLVYWTVIEIVPRNSLRRSETWKLDVVPGPIGPEIGRPSFSERGTR